MHTLLVGISHKTAPVSVREQLALDERGVIRALSELKGYTVIEEVIILSTCNRTEFYVSTSSPLHTEKALSEFIRNYACGSKDPLAFLYLKQDRDVCRHLFEVAASLDSQVVGESQILGQVKKALQLAQGQDAARSGLTALFEQAMLVAQEVRTKSGIGKGSVSIGSVGVQLAKKILGDLEESTVLLLGAGEVGKLVVKHLNNEKVRETWIVNRTWERAQMLEEQGLGKARPLTELKSLIQRADVLITAIDGKLDDLTYEELDTIVQSRNAGPLLVIDLGVPRTFVETQTNRLRLHILTLDDLQTIADQNQRARLNVIALAKNLIDRAVDVFYGNISQRSQKNREKHSPALTKEVFLSFLKTEGEAHG